MNQPILTEQQVLEVAKGLLLVTDGVFDKAKERRGGNNRGYVLTTLENTYFVKVYFRDTQDKRNRGLQEYLFSSFLAGHGVTCVPKPVQYDDALGVGIFEFIDGIPFNAEQISQDKVDQALSFVSSINALKHCDDASAIPTASENSWTTREHVALIEKRIVRCHQIKAEDESSAAALQFVTEELTPFWTQHTGVIGAADEDPPLDTKHRCLSPSDFGFHNACAVEDKIYFFDFEYAGWDDPAKMICDFFYQPKVPVSNEYIPLFIKTLATTLGIEEDWLRRRVEMLHPLYGIKWCCILMNDFLPVGNARRSFAGHTEVNIRKSEQLQKARHLLQSIKV